MSERLLLLMNELTRRLIEDHLLLEDPAPLIEELMADGYHRDELETALGWIGRFLSQPFPDTSWSTEPFTSRGFRTRSTEEHLSFSPEAFGYLLRLENSGLIDPPTREEILERALGTYEEEIGEEEIRVISRMVLEDHGLQMPDSQGDPLEALGKPRHRH